MSKNILIIITVLVVGALAIGLFASKGGDSSNQTDTDFYLPENVENFTGNGGDSQINFQTDLTLDEVLEFYRMKYVADGLTERKLLAVQSEGTLNLVFDGHESTKALLIQAVKLPNATNVNIRLEEIDGAPKSAMNDEQPVDNADSEEDVDVADTETLTAILDDVTEGDSSGTAYIVREEGELKHTVIATLPDPSGDNQYEGWLVQQSPLEFFSTGVMTKNDDGEYELAYKSDELGVNHNFVVITEETVVDETPETHILEGLAQ